MALNILRFLNMQSNYSSCVYRDNSLHSKSKMGDKKRFLTAVLIRIYVNSEIKMKCMIAILMEIMVM